MCYVTVPSVGKRGLEVQRLLQASLMAAARRHPATTTGGGGGSMKQCLCSPTKHPGSFRCRHHQGEYVWGGRFVGKK
ncbi:hypothetical protein COLO4_34908 [Corchorus olitorius]|uniref:Uncharacterized protein n=1 Tax=Corchorus olitorius TaxID=93759 RepID=A0A1R3GJ21_9ROSI|nr:hypothetical protein COLO4_34908 [Corchorus olitorius]